MPCINPHPPAHGIGPAASGAIPGPGAQPTLPIRAAASAVASSPLHDRTSQPAAPCTAQLVERYGAFVLDPQVLNCISNLQAVYEGGALGINGSGDDLSSWAIAPRDDDSASWETLDEGREDGAEDTAVAVDTLWWVRPTREVVEEIFEYFDVEKSQASNELKQFEVCVADVVGARILELIEQGELPGMDASFLATLARRYPHAASSGRQLIELAQATPYSFTTQPDRWGIFFQEAESVEAALTLNYGEKMLAPPCIELLHLVCAEYHNGVLHFSAEDSVRRLIALIDIMSPSPQHSAPGALRAEFMHLVDELEEHLQTIVSPTASAIDRLLQRLETLRFCAPTSASCGIYAAYYDVLGGKIWAALNSQKNQAGAACDAAALARLETRYPCAIIGGRALAARAALHTNAQRGAAVLPER